MNGRYQYNIVTGFNEMAGKYAARLSYFKIVDNGKIISDQIPAELRGEVMDRIQSKARREIQNRVDQWIDQDKLTLVQ